MSQSYLWDYSAAYIVVKGTSTLTDPSNNTFDKKLAFKNNALFISCISKINNALIDDAEDFPASTCCPVEVPWKSPKGPS